MDPQIPNLKNQKYIKESSLQACYEKNKEYQNDYNDCFTNIERLKQELSDLLFYQKKLLKEREYLESLISGDASPMGKVRFHQPGLLEGRFLEKAQFKMDTQRRSQEKALATMEENIREMKQKAAEIEDEIEVERRNLFRLDDLISKNRANIERQKVEIAVIESKIRSIS
ncbi:hypothetical protein F3157_09170 [Virgibacillus dakarensis]|nr:hypothetical protein [Virgibacillus dakarensis]MTW85826.1 hypothetical protein [Virgibacillus dakarensis]